MSANDVIENVLKPIAKNGFDDALEIMQLIALLETQNANDVNTRLSDAGAGRAAMAARNAFIARLTLLVVRSYSKSQNGDLHVGRGFELIAENPDLKTELERRSSIEAVKSAEEIWARCKGDDRCHKLEHFRNKYTAHLSEPKSGVPLPKYNELFPFALETTKAMQALAHISGVNTHNVSDWDGETTGSAEAFWKPWAA